MSSTEQTYTKGFSDMLLHAVGGIKNAGIATLAVRLTAFVNKDGDATVSVDSLCELFDCSVNTIKSYAKTLSLLDIWHLKTSAGKGHVAIWSKGSNFDTYIGAQKYQTLTSKVSNFDTNNIDNNKDSLTAHTCANQPTKKEKDMQGDTPCDPRIMEEFDKFWQAFFFGRYAKYEKEQDTYRERAAGVWAQMSVDARAACLREIKAGKRYDKTYYVLYYLQKYPEPLRIWYDGDEGLSLQLVNTLVRLRYKNRWAYCRPEDVDRCVKAGARVVPYES